MGRSLPPAPALATYECQLCSTVFRASTAVCPRCGETGLQFYPEDKRRGTPLDQQTIRRDCAAISHGTLAHLAGVTSYSDLDIVQQDWCAWVVEQQLAGFQFEDWTHAWRTFALPRGYALSSDAPAGQ